MWNLILDFDERFCRRSLPPPATTVTENSDISSAIAFCLASGVSLRKAGFWMLSGTWETDQLGYCYVIIIMITLKKESKGLEYHGGRRITNNRTSSRARTKTHLIIISPFYSRHH